MSEAQAVPTSYKDPFWSNLAAGAEQRQGLPPGLLVSILTNGEKSNADQVSEAGAQTPFQITPATRNLVLKRDGIDAYLNPRNAADTAALVLKDGMNWAKSRTDDPNEQAALAAGFYHAGGDTANWGPRTSSYMQRVSAGLSQQQPQAQQPQAQQPQAQQPQQGSQGAGTQLYSFPQPPDLGKLIAQSQMSQAPSQLQNIYDAYQGGRMSPQDAQEFEADVRAGKMMLPRAGALKGDSAPGVGGAVAGTGAPQVPSGVLQAYQSGQMTPQDMVDFERDVRAGVWQLPQGSSADTLFGSPQQPKGMLDRLTNAVTGNDRKVPATEALPDWTQMPSLDAFSGQSVGVGKLLKIAAGTLLSNPQETAQILQANIPGLQMHQDQKGNYLFTDPADGQTYAYKPGFRASDLPRAAGAVAAFTPAGRAETMLGGAVANAGTQAAIEGAQAGAGGTFNPGDVATAGAIGAAVPFAGRVLDMAAQPAKTLINRVMGRVEPAAADAGGSAAGAAPVAGPAAAPPITEAAAPAAVPPAGASGAQAVPAAAAAAQPIEGIAQTVGEAAKKGVNSAAARDLASMAAPSAETTAAAERLGIENYLQPDHVTTNDAFRQIVGLVKSINPAGGLAQTEKEGLAKVAQRASSLIDEAGGTNDMSLQDASLKAHMQATHTELAARENKLYDQLREKVGPTTSAPADNALAFAQQRATELGGPQNLSPMEKTIVSRLTPKGSEDAAMLDALGPAAKQQAMTQSNAALAAREVAAAMQKDDSWDYALRVLPEDAPHASGGAKLGPSRRWEDGVPTDDMLAGTSGIGVSNPSEQSVLEAMRRLGVDREGAHGYYPGTRVVLIRGERVGTGEDPGEVLLKNAEVAGAWNKAGEDAHPMLPNARGAGAAKQPTYALLDDVRRDVGAAARQKGPFSDADTGLAKKYYGLLSQDQAAVADAAGAGDIAQAARATTMARKGMEDDLTSLFGKNLDQSIVPKVSGAMTAAAGGDTSKLLAVLKATPDSMKQEVVASGLGTVFRNAATRGEINFSGYAKWFENLQRNQQAYAAVMSNLPAAARTQLTDLYRVSKGISDSLAARTKTGLSVAVKDQLQSVPDTVASRLFDLAKHAGKGIAADAVGGHGAGLAMGLFSALKGNAKPNAVKAIDELLTSPEFQHLAATAGTAQQTQTASAFAYSKAFTKFARALGNPRELSNRERWVLQALQARNSMN